MAWAKYYLRTIGSSIVLLFMVVLVMFLLLQIAPGDPVQSLVGQAPISAHYRAEVMKSFGLDRPVWERFWAYISNICHGNLGHSFASDQPVSKLIVDRLGNTLILTVPALLIASVGGIALGALAARTRSRILDRLLSSVAIAGFSVPSFWLALLLIMVFSVKLGWLPAQGMTSYTSDGVSISHLILPVLSLAAAELAFMLKLMRSSMIEVLGQDYIDTARAKGLSSNLVLWRHGMLNSMLPMVSVIGYSLGFLLTGSVLVESVFGWPGMGLLLFDSIQTGENMVVMGILFVSTVVVLIVNLLTDVVYRFIDPRIHAKFRRTVGV